MNPLSLFDLARADCFEDRHIGPGPSDQKKMLDALGHDDLDALVAAIIPEAIRRPPEGYDALGQAASEVEALTQLQRHADNNSRQACFIGQGYAPVLVPPVIQRNVLENPAWYTAYTPYQPEIAQGRLEALLNFQQLCIELTGRELASASLLDEATAAAEAMGLARRQSRNRAADCFFVDEAVHPQTLSVLRSRADALGIELVVGPRDDIACTDHLFGALVQYPDTRGEIAPLAPLADNLHERGALLCVASELMALVRLCSPGEQGADVVFGSAQRFGVPMGFGGPHAAFFVTRDSFRRSMPGRVIGVSRDARGRPALRMAMQTREQHIRREKATSNICTAEVLLANMAAFYAMYHGPVRLRKIADRIQRLTDLTVALCAEAGLQARNSHWFDTVSFDMDKRALNGVRMRAAEAGINLCYGEHGVGVTLAEPHVAEDVLTLVAVLTGRPAVMARLEVLDQAMVAQSRASGAPEALVRRDEVPSHPVFRRHHSETGMLRYLRSLEEKDYSLVHGMIPLGSCTMKLNATSEMMPVSWAGLCDLHPFVPPGQSRGYRAMMEELADALRAMTGFDGVSLQPNSGAQGELAGLLAIRGYLRAQGETQRDICLIPQSAHGTNPASATLAGMQVQVVRCDARGNVDLEDLDRCIEKAGPRLACLMVTYPSTHGVFETNISRLCQHVHAAGGQVYMDGANLNAQVGWTSPAIIGADVCHINLHKTFCIPHGGGGPGMGPIAVRAHLIPWLPGHPLAKAPGLLAEDQDAVSSAPFGSASILPISWMYIRMMGASGLRQATAVAMLNANYLARRLEPAYPVLYRGEQDCVAHECLIDLRPLKAASGITEEDIAKRLVDYGFHAPTMSFPVAGTLMIEPTESETLAEMDRFVDAMLSIREEIRQVEAGVWPADDNPLVNAPHTLADIQEDTWTHPYSRQVAAWPVEALQQRKFWPAVNRVDNVWGDRNLFCSCAPVESYE
jgi:glycine dehydrogenase